MNSSLTLSNVYYLPARVARETPSARRPRKTAAWARVQRAWWRLSFMAAEICSIVRRRGRHLFLDDDAIVLGRMAELTERPVSRGPARIIDFESARDRLRPAAV
ncbi:MAG: hypothetical protein HYU41_15365 [Candidatus Rokubacteria bacterium]|nr:hypothetical protein [Candidatus Rokubacteria bacterium]